MKLAETHQIKCDACDKDLTYTGNCNDYYLVLGSASKSHYPGGGAVTMMAIPTPVDRTYHFCGLACMDVWREPGRLAAIAAKEKQEARRKWREENVRDGGMIAISQYPEHLR